MLFLVIVFFIVFFRYCLRLGYGVLVSEVFKIGKRKESNLNKLDMLIRMVVGVC